jgi:hypothetical protein
MKEAKHMGRDQLDGVFDRAFAETVSIAFSWWVENGDATEFWRKFNAAYAAYEKAMDYLDDRFSERDND